MAAYLYKWTQISTGKWYVGSRTARGCHPEDGYICSSKIVKPLIVESRSDWHREILALGDPKYILELEHRFLSLLDAANDDASYNRHNGGDKFTTAGRPVSEEKRQHQRSKMLGRKHTPEAYAKIKQNAEARRGIKLKPLGPMPEEQRRKISEALKGRKLPPITEERRQRMKSEPHRIAPKSEEWKQKMSEGNASRNNIWWEIVRPDGTKEQTNNLKGWCRKEFGEQYYISATTNLRYKPYKGYSATKITCPSQTHDK